MPSKIQLDENLWFLFICLQKSDYKAIDFNAVGEATNLKPPAARMRYTRLRRQIEGGTLIGTQGIPFAAGADKIADAKKRASKKSGHLGHRESGVQANRDMDPDHKIKVEHLASFEDYATSSSESDSEDDIPLAKLRSQRLAYLNPPPPNPRTHSQPLQATFSSKPMLGGLEFGHFSSTSHSIASTPAFAHPPSTLISESRKLETESNGLPTLRSPMLESSYQAYQGQGIGVAQIPKVKEEEVLDDLVASEYGVVETFHDKLKSPKIEPSGCGESISMLFKTEDNLGD